MCSNYQHTNIESSEFATLMRHGSFKFPASHIAHPHLIPHIEPSHQRVHNPQEPTKPLDLHPSPPPKKYRLLYFLNHSSATRTTINHFNDQSLSPPTPYPTIPPTENSLSDHVLSQPAQPYRSRDGDVKPIPIPLPIPIPHRRAGSENLPSHCCPYHSQST